MAPILGGLLLVAWDWRVPFFMTGLIGAWLLFATFRMRETIQRKVKLPNVSFVFRNFGRLLRLREFAIPALAVGFTSLAFNAFTSIAPALMEDVLGVPAANFGWYFVFIPAGFFTGSYICTVLTSRIGARGTILIGSIVGATAACGMLLLAVATTPRALPLFLVMGVVTLGNGINQAALIVQAVSANPLLTGAASGLVGFIHLGLGAVGTQLVALIYVSSATPVALVVLVSHVAALLLLIFLLPRPRLLQSGR